MMTQELTPQDTNADLQQDRPEVPQSLKNTTTLIYALLGLSSLAIITAPVAVIICYIKRNEAENTWLASHFRWQIRTFWFALLWAIIGTLTILIGIGSMILTANAIWVVYRSVRGWLRMNDGKAMYT